MLDQESDVNSNGSFKTPIYAGVGGAIGLLVIAAIIGNILKSVANQPCKESFSTCDASRITQKRTKKR